MGNTVLSFGIGNLIGIGLFLVCVRSGLIHKWSGLTKAPRSKSAYVYKNLNKKGCGISC